MSMGCHGAKSKKNVYVTVEFPCCVELVLKEHANLKSVLIYLFTQVHVDVHVPGTQKGTKFSTGARVRIPLIHVPGSTTLKY